MHRKDERNGTSQRGYKFTGCCRQYDRTGTWPIASGLAERRGLAGSQPQTRRRSNASEGPELCARSGWIVHLGNRAVAVKVASQRSPGSPKNAGVSSDRRCKRGIFPDRCTLGASNSGPVPEGLAYDWSWLCYPDLVVEFKVRRGHPIKLGIFQAAQQPCFLNVASVCSRTI